MRSDYSITLQTASEQDKSDKLFTLPRQTALDPRIDGPVNIKLALPPESLRREINSGFYFAACK